METVVTTKEELNQAKEDGAKVIIVKGELADNLRKAKKITTIGGVALGALTAAIAATPFTGGLSLAAAVPIATLTGMEVATIIAVSAIGISLIMAIYKDYNAEISKDKVILTKK